MYVQELIAECKAQLKALQDEQNIQRAMPTHERVVRSSDGLYLKHIGNGVYKVTHLLRACRMTLPQADSAQRMWHQQGYQPGVYLYVSALAHEAKLMQEMIDKLQGHMNRLALATH